MYGYKVVCNLVLLDLLLHWPIETKGVLTAS